MIILSINKRETKKKVYKRKWNEQVSRGGIDVKNKISLICGFSRPSLDWKKDLAIVAHKRKMFILFINNMPGNVNFLLH
jgi:hypothetical protein